MPFDIQTKGLIVGILVGYLVLPRVIGAVAKKKA